MPRLAKLITFAVALVLAACTAGAATSPAPDAIPGTEEAPAGPVIEGLEGRLIYTQPAEGLVSYDLETGSIETLFNPGQNGLIAAANVSPDNTQVVMAYAPPPGPGDPRIGYTSLYVMPLDGSGEPELLLEAGEDELYTWPEWSADGQSAYFGHLTPTGSAYGGNFGLAIEHLVIGEDSAELIVDGSFWPRVSPDGTQIAYVSVAGPTDALMVANADGSDAHEVVPPDAFGAIDAVTWTPDGSGLLFSALPKGEPPMLSWLNEALGVQVAKAHDAPSDLWRVTLDGGELEQLTDIADFGLYPAYSPDGATIALLRAAGIYVMDAAGGELSRLMGSGPVGSVDWIP